MYLQYKVFLTSEEIYEDLCRKIEKLEYMPGDSISENELCSIYGVTRHVIRNSLARLKQRRLVDVFPQRGTYISLIDMGYIKNILYLREAVEQETIYRIIEQGNNNQLLEQLRNCVNKQKQIEDTKSNSDVFYEIDDQFHQYLLAAVEEESVLSLISDHYIHVRRWRNMEVATMERIESLVDEHEMIIEAIENGDYQIARTCLHYHLDTIERYSKQIKHLKSEFFVN